MSSELTLELDTALATTALAGLLVRDCDAEIDESGPYPTAFTNGLTCWIMPQSSLGQELAIETFDINTSMCMRCRLDKCEWYTEGMNMLIQTCMVMLKNTECDLVLLGNGEKGILLRKNGHVFLDERDEYWRERWAAAFAKFNIPFQSLDLPRI
jgi:hypothetical protein